MSTFDHIGLIQSINEGIAPLRKGQPEAMAGFSQLALAIGIAQPCSGCVGFHVKALHKLGCTHR